MQTAAGLTVGARMQLFEPCCEGIFRERPNRFLVRVEVNNHLVTGGEPAGRQLVEAHCPNPGRMIELLLPGTRVILEKAPGPKGPHLRKTAYTLAAAYRGSRAVPLDSGRANRAAGRLVLPALYPEAREMSREVSFGRSRLDYLVHLRDSSMHPTDSSALEQDSSALVEVKTCTLVEQNVALFPDAPTERGTRHLEELAEYARRGGRAAVLFLIVSPEPSTFMPNVHTDPGFSRRLVELRDDIEIHAAAIRCSAGGCAEVARLRVPVDLDRASRHLGDRGCYVLALELRHAKRVEVGSLGALHLAPGTYLYVGSAEGGLAKRIRRHLRRTKRLFWHIDYLSLQADRITAFPIRSARSLECSLARSLAAVADAAVPGFGCSDCSCASHLFRLEGPALESRGFLDVLHRYRHREALYEPTEPLLPPAKTL